MKSMIWLFTGPVSPQLTRFFRCFQSPTRAQNPAPFHTPGGRDSAGCCVDHTVGDHHDDDDDQPAAGARRRSQMATGKKGRLHQHESLDREFAVEVVRRVYLLNTIKFMPDLLNRKMQAADAGNLPHRRAVSCGQLLWGPKHYLAYFARVSLNSKCMSPLG
jgi:hypothetical protein